MAEQLRKSFTGLPLKTETDVFLPAVMPGRLIETVMEVDNFSAAPIPSSVFEVPSGYKPASLCYSDAVSQARAVAGPH